MGNQSKGTYRHQFSAKRTHCINKRKWGDLLRNGNPKTWGFYCQICNALGKDPYK